MRPKGPTSNNGKLCCCRSAAVHSDTRPDSVTMGALTPGVTASSLAGGQALRQGVFS